MARAERNRPLTGTRGPLVVLEWTWFQWVSGIVATIAPTIAVLAWLDRSSGSALVNLPNGLTVLLALLNGYLFSDCRVYRKCAPSASAIVGN